MKNIIVTAIITMLCIVNLSSAQSVSAPESIIIGDVAVVDALAKAKSVNIVCGSNSTTKPFEVTHPLFDVKSINDIKKVIERIHVEFLINDPKDEIHLSAYIADETGRTLFRSDSAFHLEKVYDGSRFIYRTPYYAGDLWFNLSETEIPVWSGVDIAYMVNRNGDTHRLSIVSGFVQIPGWMNNSGQYSELVIGNIRYDMNTGTRLYNQVASTGLSSVHIDKIQQLEYSTGMNYIDVHPYYGYIPNTEIKVTNNHLMIWFRAVDSEWIHPISVRVATLDDLKPGGKGWTVYPYAMGMNIPVISGLTYYLYPEYQDEVIGSGLTGNKG